MDILFGINFSNKQWKLILEELDVILETFPKLQFFKNTALKEEYAGICLLVRHKFYV